ncbi:glycoside hydrolase family 5 protein [Reichenbachiella ulvae]|uniref:Glycoside hydrolase family 5 protein n=1 Tax=Reichenbachiella ulvae TaxID=2980104 RepID=A0ABT3CUP9_9BACT|nr:glycoside hydrolase family 5 protein [Reichenbachiella ulvae]MCV9387416.1 glycoside hydrolase family 5 protein [Reichenbachiella ulvae]
MILSSILLVAFMLFSCSNDDGLDPIPDPEPDPEVPVEGSAFEVIKAMSAGFNLGNTFDNGINSTVFSNIKPIIDIYHGQGMKHVRIPVTWMDRFNGDHIADEQGNINANHPRFQELVKVIDYALELNMYVVINTHHEHWLKDHYDGTEEFDTRFANLWTEIATYFKDYPSELIFEVLNEPEGKLGEWSSNGEWPSPGSSLAVAYTRMVNELGYEAIRATGGNNTTRVVMVSTNGQGNDQNIEEIFPSINHVPGDGQDAFVAIQVHSYNPWAFCGHTGSNTAFPGTEAIEEAIAKVAAHSDLLGVPINYGEFGVGREQNVAERNTDLVRGYYKTFANATLGADMSYSVWDDRGWFGLVNSSGSSFINDIVPTMLKE